MQLTQLTKREEAELGRLEETIATGLDTFIKVGEALVQIRDKRLYRDSHPTFEEYCRNRWNFSKTHANRLIASATAVANLGDVEVRPANEAQVRPLTLLPPAKQGEAWQEAMKRAGGRRVTAEDVRAAVDALLDSTPKESSVPPSITFVDRIKIVQEWTRFAKSKEVPGKYLDLVSQWLRERLDR